eukprot:scaffold507_cov391-Prasinococcus_capsulatus_cf.AAC.6
MNNLRVTHDPLFAKCSSLFLVEAARRRSGGPLRSGAGPRQGPRVRGDDLAPVATSSGPQAATKTAGAAAQNAQGGASSCLLSGALLVRGGTKGGPLPCPIRGPLRRPPEGTRRQLDYAPLPPPATPTATASGTSSTCSAARGGVRKVPSASTVVAVVHLCSGPRLPEGPSGGHRQGGHVDPGVPWVGNVGASPAPTG